MVRLIASVLFCAVLCSCYASCAGYIYEDCGSTLGKFTNVSISNCNQLQTDRCSLKRGKTATININFIPNTDISQVNLRVFGIIMDLPVPFPMDKPDVCKDPDSGVECPLKKDQKYIYTTSLLVQKKFPAVSVDIKWEFLDEKKDTIVCIQFPAKVV